MFMEMTLKLGFFFEQKIGNAKMEIEFSSFFFSYSILFHSKLADARYNVAV